MSGRVGGGLRDGLAAEEADLFDAFCGEEFCEAVPRVIVSDDAFMGWKMDRCLPANRLTSAVECCFLSSTFLAWLCE